MKIVVFGDQRRVGALVGEDVLDLGQRDLRSFIEGGQRALDSALQLLSDSATPRVPLDTVKLHAPWAERRIACMGGNFADHLAGMESGDPPPSLAEITQKTRERGQWGFWKVSHFVSGRDEDIAYPRRTEYFDYEGEVAIVIGRQGKDIPASRIADYVWGVTLFNDWSIRDGMGGPTPLNYNVAKNFDGSTSMGPCIVVGELEPQNVDLQTCVNGQVRQSFNTRDMIFSFAEALEFLSRDFTFVPGDVIAGGTAAGTAADKTKRAPDGSRPKDLFLKPGDVVELSSRAIGSLRNRVVCKTKDSRVA